MLLHVAVWGIPRVYRILKGNKLAVLGEQGVGKTCLISFLSTGSVPRRYEPDSYAKDVRGRKFEIKDLNLKIPDMRHLPGSTADYPEWKEVTNEADIVLYLFRTDRLMKEHIPTKNRVLNDMGQIQRWLNDNDDKPKKFPLYLIGTHCDLTDPDFTTLSLEERRDYKNKVYEMPIFIQMIRLGGGYGKVKFVPGVLKTRETTEQLVYDLFRDVKERENRCKRTGK